MCTIIGVYQICSIQTFIFLSKDFQLIPLTLWLSDFKRNSIIRSAIQGVSNDSQEIKFVSKSINQRKLICYWLIGHDSCFNTSFNHLKCKRRNSLDSMQLCSQVKRKLPYRFLATGKDPIFLVLHPHSWLVCKFCYFVQAAEPISGFTHKSQL